MSLFQRLLGNLSEVNPSELEKEFGSFLVESEKVEQGFKLIRDVILFTDRRIISIDKQGTSGKKMRVDSIYYDTIFKVSCETGGFGIDDSELDIWFISSPYYRSNNSTVSHKKYEFPKKFNIALLYTKLEELAQANLKRLNG